MNNMDNYEHLHAVASRDWFKSSSVSLAKLDEIKATVYNINPNNQPQSLRPASVRSQKNSYTDLETEPPLSGVNLQQSSWNNNPSVPYLIKQQGERIAVNAKGPRRPWSGRKTRQDRQHEETKDRHKAFIAVKGAKYDPKSRPPSGRATASSDVGPHGRIGDGITKKAADMALEDFLKVYQASGEITDVGKLSAAYAPEDSLTPPPPVPRTSPDMQAMSYGSTAEDINHMLYGEETGDISDEEEKAQSLRLGHRVEETAVNQPSVPKLLRRPTPVRLSMTIPTMDSDDDEDYEQQDFRFDSNSPALDMELQSVTSEVSGNLDRDDLSTDHEAWTGGIQSVTMTSRNHNTPISVIVENRVTGDESYEHDPVQGTGPKRPFSVQIDETKNVTTEIRHQGDNAHKEPLKPHPPPARQRPKSAVAAVSHHNDTKFTAGIRQRPKSAKMRNLRMPTVALDYGLQDDDDDDKETIGHSDQLSKTDNQQIKPRPEIETMMSRISLSDDDEDHQNNNEPIERTVQYSKTSSKTNFYKAATGTPQAMLTTKTIAFTDAGILECKSVSKIGQMQKPPVGRIGLVKTGLQGSVRRKQHEGTGDVESSQPPRTHSAISRPTTRNNATLNTTSSPDRPISRMGGRLDDGDDIVDMSSTPDDAVHKKISRPISAPVRRRSGAGSSGRRSPTKMSTRRPKSASVSHKQSYIDKPHIALQQSSQSMKAVIPQKKSAIERQRNREAVKALKDGTLNNDKKYTGRIAFEETKRVIEYTPRQEESSSEEEIEVPVSEEPKEMREMHERLLAKGVNISATTLARGLLPPTRRGYGESTDQLPEKASMRLLNHPEAWLGDVFKKYKMAEKALHKANLRMVEQEEMDAKLAAKKALESNKKKKRKKGKSKRKIVKKKVVKTSSKD